MISFFFFNDTATTEIYTLSLHDALPISSSPRPWTTSSATTLRRGWSRTGCTATSRASTCWIERCATSCRSRTPGRFERSPRGSSKPPNAASGPTPTPKTSMPSRRRIWRTRECWRRAPHERALPLLRHSRPGGPQARPAPERRLPRGRRRAGARREGDREVHRRSGAREAPATHKGGNRLPLLLRSRGPGPGVPCGPAPGERALGVASGAPRRAAGGREHRPPHGDPGYRAGARRWGEGLRAWSPRGDAPGDTLRGRGEPALGPPCGSPPGRGGDGRKLRGARGGERPAPVALYPGRNDEPRG